MHSSREKIQQYLETMGLRFTSQRQLIFEEFHSGARHLSVDELYETLRRACPTLGYSTVHRTMKLFVDCGIARVVSLGGDRARYEPAAEEATHDHLVCRCCGSVIEFSDDTITHMRKQVFEVYGFKVDDHVLEMHGVCVRCRS